MPFILRAAPGLPFAVLACLSVMPALALAMLIDIFSERGFHATADVHRIEIPDRFDLQTGKIQCRKKKVFRFRIIFKGSEIRRGQFMP